MSSDKDMTTSTTCTLAKHITSFIKTVADESCNKKLTGIAIGVMVDGQELSAVSGWADVESKRPVSDSTIFEIGSLSKLFTSLLLAVAVNKREISLDGPVQTALGAQVTLPTDGTSQITYRSLANHRSSLPRLPDDLIKTADMENPYAHYDQEMLYACLNRMESVKPIGAQATYSNFGVGLLGHVLGKLAGSDYHAALIERVLIPLRMMSTSTESSDEQTAQLATAHKKQNKPTKHWGFTEVTVAAGGVRSSLSDIFKFLRANIDPTTSDLADELAMMREPSTLPECESNTGSFMASQYALPWMWLISLLAICAIMFGSMQWFSGFQPKAFLFIPITMLTFGAALRWGGIPGAFTLVLLMFVTWQFGGDSIEWFFTLLLGTSLTYMGAHWKKEFEQRGGGEGRLAWQSWKLGSHSLLWHNGMVGGSASYLGLVQESEIGVVVLTNTAKSVDAIGDKIVSRVVKLKENELREPHNE